MISPCGRLSYSTNSHFLRFLRRTYLVRHRDTRLISAANFLFNVRIASLFYIFSCFNLLLLVSGLVSTIQFHEIGHKRAGEYLCLI